MLIGKTKESIALSNSRIGSKIMSNQLTSNNNHNHNNSNSNNKLAKSSVSSNENYQTDLNSNLNLSKGHHNSSNLKSQFKQSKTNKNISSISNLNNMNNMSINNMSAIQNFIKHKSKPICPKSIPKVR